MVTLIAAQDRKLLLYSPCDLLTKPPPEDIKIVDDSRKDEAYIDFSAIAWR